MKKSKISKHHIIPISRGGKNLEDNLVDVKVKDHQNYHALFDNKTPQEIVNYLNDYFWKGHYEISIEEKWEYKYADFIFSRNLGDEK